MKRDPKALQKRRLRAARLLEKGLSQAEVARELGVSRQSVSRWAAIVDAEGRDGLKARPFGRPGQFGKAERRELARILKQGAVAAGFPTELWTLPRIQTLIAEQFGIRYSEVHVWRLLRAMGFSCQRPTGRATQRDEQAIRRWKRKQWPALKKTPKNGARRLSS